MRLLPAGPAPPGSGLEGIELLARADLLSLRTRRLLVDRHAGALGCLAEPRMYLPRGDQRSSIDHSAVEGVRSDLTTLFILRSQLGLPPGGCSTALRLLGPLVVRRFGRQDELPVRAKSQSMGSPVNSFSMRSIASA